MADINKVVITEEAEFDYEEILGLPMPKGYPHLYRKEDIQVTMSDGTEVTAMVYIMNRGLPDYPNASYYRTIEEGYHDCGLDPQYLKGALEDTEMRKKKQ